MESLSQNEKIVWTCWEEKSPREVVREAAAKGTHISLAIRYLMEKNSWNESTATDWFLSEVKAWTIQLLMRKQIFKVLHVLNKVNINPEEHLMLLAKDSTQIAYRDFIVEHLEKLSKDMQTENIEQWRDFKRHWNLLRYLENSFEADGTFKQNKVFGAGKDRIFVNESEIKSLTIEGIQKYSQQRKCVVATALFFQSFEFSLLDFSSPSEMWNYLVEQNKAMILVRWINVQMSEVVRDKNARYHFFNNENFVNKFLNVDTKGFSSQVLVQLDEIFRVWQITNEMIEHVASSNCFSYTKMCIYDTLSSYGIINSDERDNLYQIISRLSRTQNLKLIDDIFTESCSTVSKTEFNLELAKYCVKNKLYKVLTMCVDGNTLDTDLSHVEPEAKDCIELWLLFKSIEETSDRQSHVVPVYKTCEQIAKDDVNSYISSNPQLIIGMILLEDSAKLFDIFSEEEFLHISNFKLPNIGYKDHYPHLYNIYKKFLDSAQTYESKDVNVYQLLSGYKGLDVAKVFEFQLINQQSSMKNVISGKPDRRSLGSLLSSDMEVSSTSVKTSLSQKSINLPHFAEDKLMKRYGYVAKLNHIYYLKQYRPCKASQTFVAQQYLTYNRLQEKSVKSACCEAHALALQNWNDPAMSACAVSFVAMIGCNPTRCRVHMSAARLIKSYLLSCKDEIEDQANEIVNEYMSKLVQSNDDAAKDILYLLEEITIQKLREQHFSDGKFDIAAVLYEYQTVVKFAMLHGLQLPEMLLKEFVKNNSWFNFLLFGDVYRYPLPQMLQLSQGFVKRSYAEHLKYIMLHKNAEESSDKDQKSVSNNGQRRLSRLNSMETNAAAACEEWSACGGALVGRELWETAAACHGPEDPPAALLRAADLCDEPLLVLVASCYEPNAVDVLWAQWVVASLGRGARSPPAPQRDAAQQRLSGEQLRAVAELCLLHGHVTTLHESVLIFMPESPMVYLTSFFCRCIRQNIFDAETDKLLNRFNQLCLKKYSVDASGPVWQLSREVLQKVSVALVKIALSQCFDSAYHQRQFLKCLATTRYGKGFMVPYPNFATLYEILQISMETSTVVNVAKMLQDDANEYLDQCIADYIANKEYEVAYKIAKLAGLPINNILTSEWTDKYEKILAKDDVIEDTEWTLFIAQCSEAFKNAAVTFHEATEFLANHVNVISDPVQKFYSYRVILTWFKENLEYGARREKIEHLMWNAYFQSESQSNIFLNSCQSTMHFVLNGQKDKNLSLQYGLAFADKPFSMTLSEIEIESDVGNIEEIVEIEEPEMIDSWRGVIYKLMGAGLLVEAFRLSSLYRAPAGRRGGPVAPCPVHVVRTCLRLAEGACSPYDLPPELRLAIASPLRRSDLSISGISDASFEELVLIQEKQEPSPGGGGGGGSGGGGGGGSGSGGAQLAVREDADRLAALDALAARCGLAVAKQVASYYRIALQINWSYAAVLKYDKNPIDFINYVSGRARMPLANLVFRTFNVPPRQIAEYLCREMVTAIISPHLVKTSTFRQKEHFQYTLWGYTLSSDIEMFLNMRPDACAHIGRLMLDHLMAFRKMYKATADPNQSEDNLDDAGLDVDALIDDEYLNIEDDDLSAVTDGATVMSADTDSLYSVSTMYTVGDKTRDSRRNLFDVITGTNAHVRYEVKSNIRKITKGAKLSTKQVNIISVELLVLCHECSSCACDTEGVAVALRSAQALAARLLAARSWRLMVRLLTGLARYTEMAYVFQALRDNHQFEFLLGQFDYMLGNQIDKINEFKQGLLDYLKRHCPGDTDAYIMVALHFNMYAEAANVKRKQALGLIEDLERMALDSARAASKRPHEAPEWLLIYDNAANRSLLDTALNHCTDAAELYLSGGCTGAAGEMAALAQQVALQTALLDASPTRLVLNKSTHQLYKLVSEYLSFMEGLVLLAGRGGEAWRELAYRRALTNDQAYLRDMAAYRPDVARHFLNRYKTEKTKTSVSQAAMSELRNLCR